MIQLRSTFLKSSSLQLFSTSCAVRKYSDDKKKDAISKLNSLLTDLSNQKSKEKVVSKLDLAKPKQLKKIDNEKEKKEEGPTDLAGKLEVAAKKVANSYGGDTNKTESELLNLLLAYQKDPSGESKATPTPSLSDLISGMKVERKEESHSRRDGSVGSDMLSGRAREVRHALRGKRPLGEHTRNIDKPPQRVHLWSESSGLGIFETDKLDEFQNVPRLVTWSSLHEKDLKLSVTHPPSNIFEQMILWTEQGKLWHFPIDNEQGLVEESKVDFTQHVMLDQHLHPWCPDRGPIRTFMELVLVGLSKNPYYRVEEKVEHILWFRDYFAMKNSLLKSMDLPEIEGGDPNFSLDVDIDYKKWAFAIDSPRNDH